MCACLFGWLVDGLLAWLVCWLFAGLVVCWLAGVLVRWFGWLSACVDRFDCSFAVCVVVWYSSVCRARCVCWVCRVCWVCLGLYWFVVVCVGWFAHVCCGLLGWVRCVCGCSVGLFGLFEL